MGADKERGRLMRLGGGQLRLDVCCRCHGSGRFSLEIAGHSGRPLTRHLRGLIVAEPVLGTENYPPNGSVGGVTVLDWTAKFENINVARMIQSMNGCG